MHAGNSENDNAKKQVEKSVITSIKKRITLEWTRICTKHNFLCKYADNIFGGQFVRNFHNTIRTQFGRKHKYKLELEFAKRIPNKIYLPSVFH